MIYCKCCGRKGIFLRLNSEGLCSKCALAEEEARRILLAEEMRKKKRQLELVYQEMCFLYNKVKNIDLCDGLSVISDKYCACERFAQLCDDALDNDDFLDMFGEKILSQHPFGYSAHLSQNDTVKEYIANRRIEVKSAAWKCQDFIEKSKNFKILLSTLPRVPVLTDICGYAPDDDPDFGNIQFTNITKSTNLGKVCDFVVVDVETTGLNSYKDEITQISAVKFREFEAVDCFSTYIKPNGIIPQATIKINGITAEMVKDAPAIEQIVSCFRSYIGDKLPVVGHNLIFDLRFLCNNACITLSTKRKYYDTLALSRKAYASDSYKLDYLDKAALHIGRENAHDSLSDCLVTGLLFHDICLTRTSE